MSGLHKTHSLVNIPFSWENQPGISKVIPHSGDLNRIRILGEDVEEELKLFNPKKTLPLPLPLPPPPFKTENPKLSPHGIYVPLPPCAFQPPPQQRAPEKKLSKKEAVPEDPFLAAFVECTRSRKQRKGATGKRNVWGRGLEKLRLGFACGCGGSGTREDATVRRSQASKLPEERDYCAGEFVSMNYL